MRWSDIRFDPPARTLRQFAGLWLVVFLGLACWQGLVKENSGSGLLLAGLALAVGPLGLIKPQFIRPIFVGALIASFPIGWVVSRVLLAVLFYGLFTPLGLCFRLLGRDPLQLRRPRGKETYFLPKGLATDPGSYFNQF
jgi:hypothetical protein